MSLKLFGTDGIRGRSGEFPLDDKTVYAVGRALAGQIAKSRNPNVLVGMDTRVSSMHIVRLLAAGLQDGGAAHAFAGVVPTPAVAYATQQGDYSLGIEVSASHNPFDDNGIKVFGPFGYKLPDQTESEIEGRVEGLLAQPGRVRPIEPDDEPDVALQYAQHLVRAGAVPRQARHLRFVVDCANGAASEVAPILFEAIGADVKFIACAPNGRNINLDCGALHMDRLAEEVVASGADFGAALDGDADRCLFVDELGGELHGDNVLLLMAQALKRKEMLPDNLVVATVMSNLGLELALQDQGIKLVRTPVGDKYVIDEMLSTGAALGGEQSGHVIFGDYSTTGDGLLSLLMVLRTIVEEGVPCSELRSRLKVSPQKLINVRVREKRPLEQLPEIRDAVADRELELAGRGRVVIRYSGTEPVVRVMVEAENQRDVVQHCTDIARLFEKHLGQ
jgi:phosphoglucosamine mutase